jgi:hypothetical protein
MHKIWGVASLQVHPVPHTCCRLDYGRSKGVEYSHQPPNLGFNDAGVPEWPGDGVEGAGDGAQVEKAGEPQASELQEATRRDPGDSDPAAGTGAADGGTAGADPE